MKKLPHIEAWAGAALAAAVFVVYLTTVSHSVRAGDCGELATTVTTLGIAHPTGYPLFTLLGWTVAHLPLGGRVIYRLNLLVAFECALAVFFFFRLFAFLLSEQAAKAWGKRPAISPQKKKGNEKQGNVLAGAAASSSRGSGLLAAASAVLVLAFSKTYWSQAVSLEVYALHLLCVSIVLLLFLRALAAHTSDPGLKADRLWLGFALALGLSFTNHMTTVLLAPAFLFLFFATCGFGRPAWIKIGRAIPFFLIGLSPYLYLWIRASQKPLMNWGDPSTLANLWAHVTGEQFRSRMFSSVGVAQGQLRRFAAGYAGEFGYLPLLFALIGLPALYRRSRALLGFALLLFLACLAYAVNYDIPDIGSYFLTAYVATAIFIACGVRALLEFAPRLRVPAAILAAGLFLFPLCLHYRQVDASRDYATEDYARNLLASLDSGGLVLSNREQMFFFPAFYLQTVEGVRPDVGVVSMTLLQSPWFYAYLDRVHPDILRGSEKEVRAYSDAQKDFDLHYFSGSMATFDFRAFNGAFVDLVQSILWKNYADRPIYVTADIAIGPEIQKVPAGLTFRLFQDKASRTLPLKEFAYRPLMLEQDDSEGVTAQGFYAAGYADQGTYRAVVLKDTAAGVALLRKALAIKPDFPAVEKWMRRLHAEP